ncbi:MAG: hypothetical protein PUE85_00120 [Firmicutes bacterium]|nr:hypothetical protein [Bacillota bacterium]
MKADIPAIKQKMADQDKPGAGIKGSCARFALIAVLPHLCKQDYLKTVNGA